MRINAEKFIESFENLKFKKNIFLISGNEETIILKTKELLIDFLKSNNFNQIEYTENEKLDNHEVFFSNSASLFGDKKIIIHKNPKEIDIEIINLHEDKKIAVIIFFSKTLGNSKTKKFFDNSADLYSIIGYKISENYKKNLINSFLNKHKIILDTAAYWFFYENSDNKYQLLENELYKLLDFKESEEAITLDQIQRLLILKQNSEIESLFFYVNSSNKIIIQKTREMIVSSSDFYFFLQRTKFFIDLLIVANISYTENQSLSLIEKTFPKYLFKYKNSFTKLIPKINAEKTVAILELLKKTELLIRQNDSMYLLVSQRLLLNLKKQIN